MIQNILPTGWRYVTLGECCQIVSGAIPRREKPDYWNGNIAWVTLKDIANLPVPILEVTPEKITELGLKSCSARILPVGSVLFSFRAPIGHVAIVGKPMATNQGFKSLVPGNQVDSSYLYRVIRHITPQIVQMGRGATF